MAGQRGARLTYEWFFASVPRGVFMRKAHIYLILILVLALAARVGRCFLTDRIDKDSVVYVEMAEDWREKGMARAFERNPRIPPLYTALMAGGAGLGLGAETAGHAVSVIAGVVTVFAVWLAARAVFSGSTLPLTAALLAAAHPFLIRVSEDVMRDSLFVCLTACSLAAAAYGARRIKVFLVWPAAGGFAALAVMTRSEGLELLPVFFAWGLVELALSRGRFRKTLVSVFLAWCLSAAGFAAVMLAALPFLHGASSRWEIVDHRAKGYLTRFITPGKDKGEK
jgi:4-amino-4-deoxy-L-arabinose transferase-like glycosyltransferase